MIDSYRIVYRRWGLILLVAACRLTVAAGVTLPLWEAVDATSLGRLPGGDSSLFEPGGLILVEWLRLEGSQLIHAVQASLLLSILGGLLLLFPLALLIAGLTDTKRLRFADHGLRAFLALPRLVLLAGLTCVVQTLSVLALLLAFSALSATFSPDDRGWLLLAFLGVGLLLCAAAGIVEDLARAGVMAHGLGVRASLAHALDTCRQKPIAVAWVSGVPAALATLLVFGTTWWTLYLSVPRHWPAWLDFTVHETCFVLLVALRAVWLHGALGLTSFSQPAPGDTREGSDEPVDPIPGLSA